MQAIALAIEQLRRGDLLVIPDCGLLAGTRPAAQAAARLTDAAPIDLPEAVAALLDLADLPLKDLQGFHGSIEEDVYDVLTLDGSVAARNHCGGTAPSQVKAAAQTARASLEARPFVTQ